MLRCWSERERDLNAWVALDGVIQFQVVAIPFRPKLAGQPLPGVDQIAILLGIGFRVRDLDDLIGQDIRLNLPCPDIAFLELGMLPKLSTQQFPSSR